MADDMLAVAQQAMGPVQWYSKSQKKILYAHIRNIERFYTAVLNTFIVIFIFSFYRVSKWPPLHHRRGILYLIYKKFVMSLFFCSIIFIL